MTDKLNSEPIPSWLKFYPRESKPDEKNCPSCGEELIQCCNCGAWGCTCGNYIEMVFADDEAIYGHDIHFRDDAMGKWYCVDYCSYFFEKNFLW